MLGLSCGTYHDKVLTKFNVESSHIFFPSHLILYGLVSNIRRLLTFDELKHITFCIEKRIYYVCVIFK